MQNRCRDSERNQTTSKKNKVHRLKKPPLSQYMLYWLALYGSTGVSLVFYSVSLLLWFIWNIIKIDIVIDSTFVTQLSYFFPLIVFVQFCIMISSLHLRKAWNQDGGRKLPYIFRYILHKQIHRLKLELTRQKNK